MGCARSVSRQQQQTFEFYRTAALPSLSVAEVQGARTPLALPRPVQEVKRIAKLALPLISQNVLTYVSGILAVAFIGHLGSQQLSAGAAPQRARPTGLRSARPRCPVAVFVISLRRQCAPRPPAPLHTRPHVSRAVPRPQLFSGTRSSTSAASP